MKRNVAKEILVMLAFDLSIISQLHNFFEHEQYDSVLFAEATLYV